MAVNLLQVTALLSSSRWADTEGSGVSTWPGGDRPTPPDLARSGSARPDPARLCPTSPDLVRPGPAPPDLARPRPGKPAPDGVFFRVSFLSNVLSCSPRGAGDARDHLSPRSPHRVAFLRSPLELFFSVSDQSRSAPRPSQLL